LVIIIIEEGSSFFLSSFLVSSATFLASLREDKTLAVAGTFQSLA